MGPIFSPVNPHDDPERLALEQRLWDDARLEAQTRETLEAERRLRDLAQEADHATPHADDRIEFLETDEQKYAAHIVADEQALEHWDHAHPLSPVARGLEEELTGIYHEASVIGHDLTGVSMPDVSVEAVADHVWNAAVNPEEGAEVQPGG